MNPIAENRRRRAVEYLRLVQQEDKELAERSFLHFFNCSWSVLEPKKPLHRSWYQDAISEHLEAAQLREIKRLIINIPPRHAKSNMVTVAWPAWWWILEPSIRFICFSYAQTLATKHSIDRRTLITSNWYQNYWSRRFQLADDQNLKTEFSNTARGHMIATSLHGSAIGKGGDVLLVDDPHNVKRADSDQMREADIIQFDRGVRSRLDDQENGVIVVVMQRLHEQDLTGHALEEGGWTHLMIPAIAEKKIVVQFPISGYTKVREPGDILVPEYQGAKILASMKKGLGSYAFAGQYQQAPSDPQGGILKRKWMTKRFALPLDETNLAAWVRSMRFDRMLISADLPFKSKDEAKEASQVCFQAWAKKGADIYMLDCFSDWLDFTDTLSKFQDFCAKWPMIMEKVIEDKANGPALISALKKKLPGLIPFTPDTDKVSRARAVSPLWEGGNIQMPERSHWVSDFVDQCAVFPKGKLKDKVDTMSQALLRFQMKPEGDFEESHVQNTGKTIVGGRGGGDQW